jgi:death on curing protein
VNDAPAEIEFLTAEVVLALHQRQLERFGGGAGLRDRGLLESAVPQPQASFGGMYVHEGLFAMAAAYLFHIVSNHPFVDGNKRAGLLAAQVFLDVNGITLEHDTAAFYAPKSDLPDDDPAVTSCAIQRTLCSEFISSKT